MGWCEFIEMMTGAKWWKMWRKQRSKMQIINLKRYKATIRLKKGKKDMRIRGQIFFYLYFVPVISALVILIIMFNLWTFKTIIYFHYSVYYRLADHHESNGKKKKKRRRKSNFLYSARLWVDKMNNDNNE